MNRNCLFLLLLVMIMQPALSQERLTDTIYYNSRWQICEAPIATYYRVGDIVADSFLYYRGRVRDYTMKDSLFMEGMYSDDGYKNGLFKFYYPNGQLMSVGGYEADKPSGQWRYYYPNGMEKAIFYFDGEEQHFIPVRLNSEDGHELIKDGTGIFNWSTNPFVPPISCYAVEGAYVSGVRQGKWRYTFSAKRDLDFTEVYDKEGNLKKVIQSDMMNHMREHPKQYSIVFNSPHLDVTESMSYDAMFRRQGDSLAFTSMLQYLIDKKPTELKVKRSVFDSAYHEILITLNSYKNRFLSAKKAPEGKIEFRLGEKGVLEDLAITGNVDSTNRNFLFYLMQKFSHIEMPGEQGVALEAYHTVYFYEVDLTPFFPAKQRFFADHDFFFTNIPKEVMVERLNEQKKKLRRYFRQMLLY